MNGETKDTITIRKDSLWKYSTFILLALLIVGGFVMFKGSGSPTANVVNNNNVNPEGLGAQQKPTQVSASVDNDAILGDKNAKVTMIEFSDYQCPFCGIFWEQTLPQIKSQYIDTGKIKFVYRDFPLTQRHSMAEISAEAAECVRDSAGNSDAAYYKMHDKIFQNQQSLSEENLKTWAEELGYNIDSCLSSGKFKNEIQKDAQDAQAAGGRGTPYFVIGKQGISGACPFSTFQQIFNAELAGKSWYSSGKCQVVVE